MNRQRGFTLIEVIAVLVLLGTLSAVVMSHSGGFTNQNDLLIEADRLKSYLRYAQVHSMNSKKEEIWRIYSPDQTSYKLQQYDDATSSWVDKKLPGQTDMTYTLSNGITLTSSLAIQYDYWGIPVQSDRTSPITADLAISLTDDSSSRSLTVVKNTGFTY